MVRTGSFESFQWVLGHRGIVGPDPGAIRMDMVMESVGCL